MAHPKLAGEFHARDGNTVTTVFFVGEALSIMDFSVFNMSWESWHHQASSTPKPQARPNAGCLCCTRDYGLQGASRRVASRSSHYSKLLSGLLRRPRCAAASQSLVSRHCRQTTSPSLRIRALTTDRFKHGDRDIRGPRRCTAGMPETQDGATDAHHRHLNPNKAAPDNPSPEHSKPQNRKP